MDCLDSDSNIGKYSMAILDTYVQKSSDQL